MEFSSKELEGLCNYLKVVQQHNRDIRKRIKDLESNDMTKDETIHLLVTMVITLEEKQHQLAESNRILHERLDNIEKITFKLMD